VLKEQPRIENSKTAGFYRNNLLSEPVWTLEAFSMDLMDLFYTSSNHLKQKFFICLNTLTPPHFRPPVADRPGLSARQLKVIKRTV